MVMVAAEQGLDAGKLATAFMRGCWVEEQDMGDKAALIAAADSAGLDGAAIATEAESSAAKARADVLTEEAKSRTSLWRPDIYHSRRAILGPGQAWNWLNVQCAARPPLMPSKSHSKPPANPHMRNRHER